MRLPVINTEKLSAGYRAKAINLIRQQILITDFRGSEQEKDFSEPVNCGGFGRVRHFRRGGGNGWPQNPLPVDPACKALNLPRTNEIRAQVFQNAVCNWRCWYCFVDFDLLSANRTFSDWLTPAQMIERYQREPSPPRMIDLTGGQPDITPEWIPWMMRAMQDRGLNTSVYLWSDDNLSNDYFWKYLTQKDLETILNSRLYGRVCCFKGFDDESFAFNTSAHSVLFDQQFELFKKLLTLRMDLYAYVTLTCGATDGLETKIRKFIDRLQRIHPLLPLRTVPLQIQIFSPVRNRMDEMRETSLRNQWDAVHVWMEEMERRFDAKTRGLPIDMVSVT